TPPLHHTLISFNSTTPPDIYPLSLHDALPISPRGSADNPSTGRLRRGRTTPSSAACPARRRRRAAWTSPPSRPCRSGRTAPRPRSEEHTSELQSPYDLVCRLLLQKKTQIHTRP